MNIERFITNGGNKKVGGNGAARFRSASLPDKAEPTEKPSFALVPVVEQMLAVRPGEYDSLTAHIMTAASSWAYSDGQELGDALGRLGLTCAVTKLSVANSAMFVMATAYFIRSACGRVGILCFRGTEPNNVMNWLTDASINPVPFVGGHVHGGFYRNVESLWHYVREEIVFAIPNKDIRWDVAPSNGGGSLESPQGWRAGTPYAKGSIVSPSHPNTYCYMVTATQGGGRSDATHEPSWPTTVGMTVEDNGITWTCQRAAVLGLRPLEAFYLTGHSSGAAMAVVAAGRIFTDPACDGWRDILRGIYTFGQPMVGDFSFAQSCASRFGDRLFRHVFSHDVVPRMPPASTGKFRHFGKEYRGTSEGWELHTKPVGQALAALPTVAVSIAAWVLKQLPMTSWMKLPYSLDDHAPHGYLEASKSEVVRRADWQQ